MAIFKNKVQLKDIEDEQIPLIVRRYFPSARKILRRKGLRDSQTPDFFADTLVKIIRKIKINRLSDLVDFDSLFYNTLRIEVKNNRDTEPADSVESPHSILNEVNKDTVSKCVSVLDEPLQKLLFLRFVEKKSYEEIAALLNFSNAVIAQFETEKAYRQLENIVRARFNIYQN